MKKIIIALSFIITACQSDIIARRNIISPPVEKTYREGVEKVINVGDFMTSTNPFSVSKFFLLEENVSVPVQHRGKNWLFILPSGEYELAGESADGQFILSDASIKSNAGYDVFGGFYISKQSENAVEFVWSWHAWPKESKSPFALFSAVLAEPKKIKASGERLNEIVYGQTGTLTYAGVAGGQIKFAYKEFTEGGLARSAFTQEVVLDYVPGKTYGYKKARFIVHEADSTKIRFTLLSHL